ncbi:hypothetical protein [Aquamicrobium sp. LC103]|uniref:hypothetical protein n=1 Tax=Aquamicrobium sp. LC103 TaxID=1120658 RepID=UPI000AD0F31D|nr:hypothetical protein [Aquamicrobium sp. LC103]
MIAEMNRVQNAARLAMGDFPTNTKPGRRRARQSRAGGVAISAGIAILMAVGAAYLLA